MENGYTFPVDLCSGLIKKITSSTTTYFNRTICNTSDHILETERRFWTKGSKLLRLDPSYSRYGPIGLCIILQERLSHLWFRRQPWTLNVVLASSAAENIIIISAQPWDAIKIPLEKRLGGDRNKAIRKWITTTKSSRGNTSTLQISTLQKRSMVRLYLSVYIVFIDIQRRGVFIT